MGFFDDPAHQPRSASSWPATAGESIEGTITGLEVVKGAVYRSGELALRVQLDGGQQRWCNNRLWRTLADARVDIGDRVRVTRGPDEPARNGEHPASTWTVERLTAVPNVPQTAAWGPPKGGPTW